MSFPQSPWNIMQYFSKLLEDFKYIQIFRGSTIIGAFPGWHFKDIVYSIEFLQIIRDKSWETTSRSNILSKKRANWPGNSQKNHKCPWKSQLKINRIEKLPCHVVQLLIPLKICVSLSLLYHKINLWFVFCTHIVW